MNSAFGCRRPRGWLCFHCNGHGYLSWFALTVRWWSAKTWTLKSLLRFLGDLFAPYGRVEASKLSVCSLKQIDHSTEILEKSNR